MSSSIGAETATTVDARASGAMPRWSRRVAVDVVGLLDALAITLGALLPAFIYNWAGGVTISWPTVLQLGLLTALIATWCLNTWHLYDPDLVHDYPIAEGRVLSALGIAVVAVLGVGMPFRTNDSNLWVWYFVWSSCSFMLLLASRVVARSVLQRAAAAGRFDIRVAVYGAGPIARRVRDQLVDPSSRIAFAGMYDDRPGDRVNAEGLTFTGRLDDLISLAHRGGVDRIIIALPASADGRISMIARRLEASPASVHIVTHVASELVEVGHRHEVSCIGPVGLLDVKGRSFGDWTPMVKRLEDVVMASLLLVLLAPLMACAALLVWLESTGPVLVCERRRGLDSSTITMLRFRTVRTDELNPMPGARTRVGAVLARFGIDRLPELLSVLTGDQSLVGPRAHPLQGAAADADDSRSAARHQIKPGLTGLAWLDPSEAGARMSDLDRDLAYIARWSPALDAVILWRTVRATLAGHRDR